jgi:hypothetical protein
MTLDTEPEADHGRPATSSLSPSPRLAAAACFDGQKVVLFGGLGPNFQYLDDTWVFDTATGWVELHPETRPPPRAYAGMAYDGTRVILFGGHYDSLEGDQNAKDYDDTWAFDGSNWTKLIDLQHSPPARFAFAMAAYGKNKYIVLFGGRNKDAHVWDDAWVFFGADWGKMDGFAPTDRSYVPMCSDNNGMQAVLYGGMKHQLPLTDLWFYSDTGWITFKPAIGPGERLEPTMAAAPGGDAEDYQFMLFGGRSARGGTYFGDTWSYALDEAGGYWRQVATTGPPPRTDASMVLDEVRNVVVLFGGEDAHGPLGDTWIYADGWQSWVAPQR